MSAGAPINVLIVDDSPFMRLTLQKILNQAPGINVLDVARDGLEGIEKLQTLKPDVVTMDVEMPVMDGLRALDEIMRWQPTPVIVLSAVTTEGAEATLKALDYGAFEVVAKPSGNATTNLKGFSQELIAKIKEAALVDPRRLTKKGHLRAKATSTMKSQAKNTDLGMEDKEPLKPKISVTKPSSSRDAFPKPPVEIVAIGTSTGGPSALQRVIPQLPANFPVPVLVAQHMPPGFTKTLAQRLDGQSLLKVREAEHGEVLKAGTVYVAPAGKQLQVQRRGSQLILNIGDESPIQTLYHPSCDVMLLSLAKEVGKGVLGVIMTGMGNDGLRGMREVKKLGGFAIAEAEETCVVYGMPRSIAEAGLADRVVPLGDVGRTIVECTLGRK